MVWEQEPNQEEVKNFVLAAHGDFPSVRSLYEQNPSLLTARYAAFDETALEAAGHTGRREIAEFLLVEGAPPTIFSAAMLGRRDEVRAFLAGDASLANKPGVHGFSVLFHAALSGNVQIAEDLVAAGSPIDNPSLHAAVMKNHSRMAEWLLDRGISDIDAPNFEGKTALAAAVDGEKTDLIAILRRHGAREGRKPESEI